jgi:iron complex transport system ATP-binding protein
MMQGTFDGHPAAPIAEAGDATRDSQVTRTVGPATILAEKLRLGFDGVEVVHDVDLEIPAGSMVALVGPNGSGKTTILRSCYRALKPLGGTVWLDRSNVWALTAREYARNTAVVAQDGIAEFDFTAAEVAALGRLPHKRGFDREDEDDRELVLRALDTLGLIHLAHRPFNQMSGGERQRVLQESRVLVLDEPTNHLDIRYQLDVLHHVRSLGMTVIAALHDLNLAAAWCDRVYVVSGGAIVAGGPPERALHPDVIDQVFGVTSHQVPHPVTGKPFLIFERRTDDAAEKPPRTPAAPARKTAGR